MTPATDSARLRMPPGRARLRLTPARQEVLRTIQAMGPDSYGREEIFQRMCLNGTVISMATIHRMISELTDAGMLICEWRNDRKAFYRLKPQDFDSRELRMTCSESGRTVVLDDPALLARILAIAAEQGFQPQGRMTTIVFGGDAD